MVKYFYKLFIHLSPEMWDYRKTIKTGFLTGWAARKSFFTFQLNTL